MRMTIVLLTSILCLVGCQRFRLVETAQQRREQPF
jgi:hypothetical protein